jgi:NADPH:quinone reductase-like Zn-dependent oxidoreductase
VVKKGGIILELVGGRADQDELKKREIRVVGVWVKPNAKDLSEIARLIDAGKIKPVVTKVLPLSEAISAEQQAETHHTRGKVVLRIADEPKG